MCVKLPSVSKWGRIALTDGVSVNATHLLLHRRTVHYANQNYEGGEIRRETKTLTDEKNDSRRHQYATKSHYSGIGI